MRTFGVDVSHWEGRINWQAAAPAIGFAYYKCTDGIKLVDDQFANNQRGCSEVGLAHAPYHYFQPSLDPLAQADHFIDVAGKRYHRYILDVEAPEHVMNVTQKLKAFLERVENLTSRRPIIYTSAGYWNEFIHPKPAWVKEYELIVAHYTNQRTPLLPSGWDTWRIWQFSDYWYFPGCERNADGDWFNGTLEECREWFGNAVECTLPEPPKKERLKMHSLFDSLHIRLAPHTRARITGKLSKGEVVEVEQFGGNDVWVRHSRGWTVVERGGYRYMEVDE